VRVKKSSGRLGSFGVAQHLGGGPKKARDFFGAFQADSAVPLTILEKIRILSVWGRGRKG